MSDEILTSGTIDHEDNIILAGYFSDSAFVGESGYIFGPEDKDTIEIFILKLKDDGTPIWHTSFGGAGFDYLNSLVTDGTGNIYSSGYYSAPFKKGTFDFNGQANQNPLLLMLDKNGDIKWKEEFLRPEAAQAQILEITSSGELYAAISVVGDTLSLQGNNYTVFRDTVTRDLAEMQSPYNTFLVKYDAGMQVKWVKGLSAANFGAISDLLWHNGRLYICGGINKGISYYDGQKIVKGDNDGGPFIAELDNSGNMLWFRQGLSGTRAYFKYLAGGRNTDIYAAGFLTDEFDMAGIHLDAVNKGGMWGDDDALLMKFEENGTPVSAKHLGSIYLDYIQGLLIDNEENVFVTGTFRTLPFGKDTLVSLDEDTYIFKYTKEGNESSFKRSEAQNKVISSAYPHGIMKNGKGDIFVYGDFNYQTKFGETLLTSVNLNESFLWRVNSFAAFIQDAEGQSSAISLYPNPVVDELNFVMNIDMSAKSVCANIYDLTGRLVLNGSEEALVKGGKYNLSLQGIKPGSYVLRVQSGNMVLHEKFIKK